MTSLLHVSILRELSSITKNFFNPLKEFETDFSSYIQTSHQCAPIMKRVFILLFLFQLSCVFAEVGDLENAGKTYGTLLWKIDSTDDVVRTLRLCLDFSRLDFASFGIFYT